MKKGQLKGENVKGKTQSNETFEIYYIYET